MLFRSLISNMDGAFDRRFLFKTHFQNPSAQTRRKILKEKLPLLDIDTINTLANNYEFSGGELDNISRKIELFQLIENRIPKREEIISICDAEKSMRKLNYSAIGFIK